MFEVVGNQRDLNAFSNQGMLLFVHFSRLQLQNPLSVNTELTRIHAAELEVGGRKRMDV